MNRSPTVPAVLAPPPNEDRTEPSTEQLKEFRVACDVISYIGRENIIYCRGTFYLWRSKGVWERVDDRVIKQKVHKVLPPEKVRRSLVENALELIRTETHLESHDFDQNPTSICCENGELHYDGNQWELKPHDRLSYCTTQIPVRYDPGAVAPRFERFLDEVFEPIESKAVTDAQYFALQRDAHDKAIVVLEMLGYTLLRSCELEKFILLVGNGANGKSVLLGVVEALCGRQNVAAVSPSQFNNKFQRAHLQSKLANIVTEIAEGAEIADAELKSIVSGEISTVEHKFQAPFDFRPYCTCWFGTNHMPHTRDFSDALFRRAIVVKFENKFEGERCNPSLKRELCEELPGILNLALKHLTSLLRREQFTEPDSTIEAKKEWAMEADQVAQFLQDECICGPGLLCASNGLFNSYRRWAAEVGIRHVLGRRSFTNRLTKHGVAYSRGSGGVRLLNGVGLKQPDDSSDASDAALNL